MRAAAIAFLVVLVAAAPVAAADPPGRVARLNYSEGSVSFRPAALEDWGPATLNYPLTTGDRLWTDGDSTAEMHIGSSVVRLAPFSAFAILNLDDRTVQLRLSEGTVDVVIRRLDLGEQFEVNTPAAAVVFIEPGVYRVDVTEDGNDTRVTVRRGQAGLYGDQAEFRVQPGQAGRLWAAADAQGELSAAEPADGWEDWCRARDEREASSASLQYVSQEMVGYEDLDEHGTWSSEPEYGVVWQPRRVPAGWAPYRDGHWAWIEPWGWTWVDDAPWGFAPFHYGRWVSLRGAWAWVPGAYVARPCYAPALVAFIGGDDWGVSVGFAAGPAVGWFPLGPREVYYPVYRASYGYLRHVNITHVNITTIDITSFRVGGARYANRRTAGAVTAVPREAFLTARSLRGVARPVSGHAVDRAAIVGMAPAIPPRIDSVLAQRGTLNSRRARNALSRTVVARTTPPPAVASFPVREPLLRANGGRPVDDSALALRQGTSDGLPVRPLARRTRPRGDETRANAGGGTGAADRATVNSRQARPGAGGTDAAENGARAWSRAPRQDRSVPAQAAPQNAPPSAGQRTPQGERPSAGQARPRGGNEDGVRPAWSRAPRQGQREPAQAAPQKAPPSAGQRMPQDDRSSAGQARPRGGDTAGSRPGWSRAPRQDRSEPATSTSQDRPSGDEGAHSRGNDRKESAAPARGGRAESPSAGSGTASGSGRAVPRRGRGDR